MDSSQLPHMRESGYKPSYDWRNESTICVVTFTEVEEDAYKIKVEEILKDGTRVDLLHRDIEGYPPTIFERTDLHLTKEAAQELWHWIRPNEGDLTLSLILNDKGQRFVEVKLYGQQTTTRVAQHLERIAESLHAQRKREAAKAAKEEAKAAKEAAKAAKLAKKRTGGNLHKSRRALRRKSIVSKHY
jgi:hypothetical protein